MHGWATSQRLPVNRFKRIEDLSEFNKDFIKNKNEKSNEIFKKFPANLHELYNYLPFLPFVFINKHNIMEVSLYHLITSCIN